MFRLVEREDGSTAIFDRSSGSLVSIVPKRGGRSTSSSTKRQVCLCPHFMSYLIAVVATVAIVCVLMSWFLLCVQNHRLEPEL